MATMDGPTEGSTEYSRPDLASRPRPRKPDGSPALTYLTCGQPQPAAGRPEPSGKVLFLIIIIIVRQTGAEPSLTVEI